MSSPTILQNAIIFAHVRLIDEMGRDASNIEAISLGILLAAADMPGVASSYKVPLPSSPADPWVRRAAVILREEEDRLRRSVGR